MAKKEKSFVEKAKDAIIGGSGDTVKVSKEPKEPKEPRLEFKDMTYSISHGKTPIRKTRKSTNAYWCDEETSDERALKYTQNERNGFVYEMKGEQRVTNSN